MAITLSLFRQQTQSNIPQSSTELEPAIIDQQVKQGILQYSKDAPEMATEDVTGDGGKYYPLTGGSAVLSEWVDGFSYITAIEYPAEAIADDEQPDYLESSDWDDRYEQGGVKYLFLPYHTPAATETIRITYATPYAWSAGSVTESVTKTAHGFATSAALYQTANEVWIETGNLQLLATHIATTITDVDNFIATELACDVPEADFFAVSNLISALCCYQIATRYSRTTDSTISADSARHTSRASEFNQRGDKFMTLYRLHMGLTPDMRKDARSNIKAGLTFLDFDSMPADPGRDYLFHGRETR